jgi:hypothetical protein
LQIQCAKALELAFSSGSSATVVIMCEEGIPILGNILVSEDHSTALKELSTRVLCVIAADSVSVRDLILTSTTVIGAIIQHAKVF